MSVIIRDATAEDAAGVASLIQENAAYYARLAPERFKLPDEEGFVGFIRNDSAWRGRADTVALVAEVDGGIAGYLEASLQPPVESSRWQSPRDLAEVRLLINIVGTVDAYKRQGIATQLVVAAEEWGRSHGASVAICDTFVGSPFSMPFWESRMKYQRQAVIFRKSLL